MTKIRHRIENMDARAEICNPVIVYLFTLNSQCRHA